MFVDKENAHHNLGCDNVAVTKIAKNVIDKVNIVDKSGVSDKIPTVICERFQGPVWIGFGCVELDSLTTKEFTLVNPGNSAVNITVDKCPTKKGFSITFGDNEASSMCVQPSQSASGFVKWNASENISVRDVAVLLMDNNLRLQLSLHGVAGKGTPKVISERSKIQRKNTIHKPVVHKVPKKKNTLMPVSKAKPEKKLEKKVFKQREECQKVLVSDKNKCIDKQVSYLLQWANGKLQGPQSNDDYSTVETNREEFLMALQHEDTQAVLQRIKREVQSNRLSLREDRNVKANVGFKDGIINMLMCYEPMWLQYGMEAIFDFEISSQKSPLNTSLKKAITESILNPVGISSKFFKEGAIVTPLVEKKFQETLRQHILCSVLSIVYLLDEARLNNMCQGKLLLFRVDAAIKSSKNMIAELSRNYLQGEGDVIKHLSGLGFNVQFAQDAFHEFDFLCSDISVHFKDGIRLARLIDLLTESYEHSSDLHRHLRVPAVSRLQKLHNVGVSLQYLKCCGIDICKTNEKSIVDGNSNATLLLLWILMFEFELKFIISFDDIQSEITRLSQSSSLESLPDGSFSALKKSSSFEFLAEMKSVLLQWCEVVSNLHSNVHIRNVTEGINDGSMLCLLVHHYHSNILSLDDIKTVHDNTQASEHKTIIFSLQSLSQNNRNVTKRHNILLLSRAVKTLGGVPFMLSSEGSTEERTMIMFLAFLFTRLVQTTKEATAAQLVQKKTSSQCLSISSKFKSHKPEVTVEIYESRKQVASAIISKSLKNYLCRKKFLRSSLEKSQNIAVEEAVPPLPQASIDGDETELAEELIRNDSSSNNDLTNKRKICMAELLLKVKNGEALKSETQGRLDAEKKLREMKEQYECSLSRALSVQKELQTQLEIELKEREKSRLEKEITTLDNIIDKAEAELLAECKQYKATLKLQKFAKFAIWKTHKMKTAREAQKRIALVNKEAVVLQSHFRSKMVRSNFLIIKRSAVRIQRAIRYRQEIMKHHHLCNNASDMIVNAMKSFIQRKKFLKIMKAIVAIQNFLLSKKIRLQFLLLKSAVVKVQHVWRNRKILICHNRSKAAHRIQSLFMMRKYLNACQKRQSAQLIQSYWMRRKARLAFWAQLQTENDLNEAKTSVSSTVITNFFRLVMLKKRKYLAVLSIENWWRSRLLMVRSKKLVGGFVRLQALRRSLNIRRSQSREVKAAFRKVQIANMNALRNPEMTLSKRTLSALNTLQKGKMISHVLRSCQTLEYSTSFSYVCCSNFVKASASKILFTLIRSCNRSTPHQELLRCALTVLINVTKDETLAEKVVHNGDTTELLVDLMQMFRDKKVIFNLSCELLTRFILAQADIKAECLAPDVKKRLDGIFHILERKHRLDMRVRNISKKAPSSKSSPKTASNVSMAPPFELMQTFMKHLQSS